MDIFATLRSMGLELPGPVYFVGAIVFGLIGIYAYRWGKRNNKPLSRWVGLALILYPYIVTHTGLLFGIGVALCAVLYADRD